MRRPKTTTELFREQVHIPPMPPVKKPRPIVTRVKIFATGCASSLEASINTWLEEQGPAFRLVDVKFTHKYSAMVIYTDPAPLDEEKERAQE